MSKLLLTGGAGFIGANFVLYWRRLHPDDSIVVLDAQYRWRRRNGEFRSDRSALRRARSPLRGGQVSRRPRCPAAGSGSTRELMTFVKGRPGHDRRYATCADKLADELDFRAETALADGLRRTVGRYLDNEDWWRAIQTGAYRDWMRLQYGAALTGSEA